MSRFPRFAPKAVAMLLGLIITLAGTDAAAASPEADKLRAELEALKTENARQAERMRALEERLRALETGFDVTTASSSACDPRRRSAGCRGPGASPGGKGISARHRIARPEPADCRASLCRPRPGGVAGLHGHPWIFSRRLRQEQQRRLDGRIPGAGRECQVSPRQ